MFFSAETLPFFFKANITIIQQNIHILAVLMLAGHMAFK